MTDTPTDDSATSPVSRILPGPGDLRHYPAHNLVAWRPEGVLDDRCWTRLVNGSALLKEHRRHLRFVDLSRLTDIAMRTNHMFDLRKRAEAAGAQPMKSAIYSEISVLACPDVKFDGRNADRREGISIARKQRFSWKAGG